MKPTRLSTFTRLAAAPVPTNNQSLRELVNSEINRQLPALLAQTMAREIKPVMDDVDRRLTKLEAAAATGDTPALRRLSQELGSLRNQFAAIEGRLQRRGFSFMGRSNDDDTAGVQRTTAACNTRALENRSRA